MKNAIKMAELMHPTKKLVFVFDNWSAHNSHAVDALSVNKMNINPGGKNVPIMRDTHIPKDNPHGYAGKLQCMQFDKSLPVHHPYKKFEGQLKGIKVILEERGLIPVTPPWTRSGKIPGECKVCKDLKKRKSKMQDVLDGTQDNGSDSDEDSEDEERPTDCCMQRILNLQSDFKSEQSRLYKVCLFFPAAHAFADLFR